MQKDTKTRAARPRLWTGDFTLLVGISFLSFIIAQSMNNGVPLYIERQGGTTTYAGFLVFVFSICCAVVHVFIGRYIDEKGRKPILVIGLIFLLIGTILPCLFPGLGLLIVFRAVQGIGFALASAAASTAAADVVPGERLGEGIGFYTLGQSVGFAVGPATGIFLCSLLYPESLFAGVSAITAILFVLVLFCSYEKHPERLPRTSAYRQCYERKKARETNDDTPSESTNETKGQSKFVALFEKYFEKRALPGALPSFFFISVISIPTTFTALFAAQAGYEDPQRYFLYAAVTMTLVRFFGGRLFDIVSPRIMYFVTVVTGLIMLLLMGFAPNEALFNIGGAFFGLAMGMGAPLLSAIAVKNSPGERYGAANGLVLVSCDLGMGLGGFIWGAINTSFGMQTIMVGGCFVLVFSYIVGWLMFPRRSKESK